MIWSVIFVSIVVVGVALVAAVGVLFVRRRVSIDTLLEHHEVAMPMMSIVATLYSVLLGFLVVCAFNRYDGCRAGLQAEANCLSDMFHLAGALPAATKTKIQQDCFSYITSVIDDEFPSMANGSASHVTHGKLDVIWGDILTFVPQNTAQSNVHQQLITSLVTTSERRRDRIFILSPGMWPILWGMLVLGNFTIIIFSYFFGLKHLRSQMIMIYLVALWLSVNVYLVVDFSTPFSGLISLSPEVMIKQRQTFIDHMHSQPAEM